MRIYFYIISTFLGLCSLCGQSTFDQAQKLADQQSYKSSSTLLINYIDHHPQRKYDIARAWWLHSYNLLQLGLLEEALQANTISLDLRRALRSNDAASNYLRQAEINVAALDYASALDASLQGMQLMIEDPVLFAELNWMSAKALLAMEHHKDGQEYLQTALDIIAIELGKKHQLYSEMAINAGFLSLKSESFNQARQYFQQAYIHSNKVVLRATSYFFAVAKY